MGWCRALRGGIFSLGWGSISWCHSVLLYWDFGGTDLEKVFFLFIKKHKCKAPVLASIFLWGKKVIVFPHKNVRTVVPGVKCPKCCLELQQCLVGFMRGCWSLLALLPGLDFHKDLVSPWGVILRCLLLDGPWGALLPAECSPCLGSGIWKTKAMQDGLGF